MPARYDDAVEKNKKYLTRAQIKALAEASQRYDAMHAANRAEAQQSMQQQYDSGFRALQNMGLAGSGATSGEVPRLQQQVRTPFEQYNQKLRDVEHQQLGVLAAAYAKQTRRRREAEKRRRAEEAALKAQRDGMKRTAMERARMQQASEAAALKAQRDGIKRTEMERMRDPSYQAAYKAQMDGIKRTAMEQERAFRESPSYQAALKAQQDGIKRTYQMQARALADSGIISGGTVTVPSQGATPSYAQTQKEYQHAQTAANAINRRTGANVNPMDLAYPGLRMYEPQMPDEAQEEQVTTAEERQVKALSDAGIISKMFGRLKPDFSTYLSNQAPTAQSEQAKPAAQGEGSLRVSDESIAAARNRLRELALKATKENVPKAELDKAKADVDLAKLKAQYPALSYIGAPEDAEEKYNIIRGEYSRAVDDLSMTLPANAEDPETRNELSRLIKTIDQAREDMGQKYVGYDPSEVLSAAQEDLGKYGISEDQARAYLDMFTEDGEMKKPEWFQKVQDELAMAELAYKNPDTYTALQLYPYLHEISDKYPDLAKWATGKVADYNMQQYGFDMPSMTDEEYTAQKKSIKGWKDALRRYDDALYSYNSAGQAETEDVASDKDNAGQDLDEITKKIKSEYGMTPDELRAAIEKFQQERDARSEYDYYHEGMLAQVEHADEKPEQPVKQYEQDYMYRLVNGLIHEDIQQNAAARFITKEQRDAYNAIYERDGIDAANKYLEDIAPYLNLQRAAKDAEYYEQFAKEHPGWAFLRARGANLAWNIPAFLENVGTGLVGAFTEERPYYDENSLMSYRSKRADYITSTQSQQILNNMNRPQFVNDTLNFMYNSAASAADSAAVMALAYLGAPTAVTSMFFASSAGNEAYRDARERGATQDQALSYAIVSAAAETVFEEVSLENLMSMDFSGKGALIKNLGSQAFVEGSEELNTGIANALADVWIMKDKSQYNLAKQQYLSEGMTENKAELKAFMDQAKDIGMEAFAGAMSAMLMVPVGKVISEAEYVTRGKKLQSETADMDRVTRMAELLGGKSMEMLNQYNADPTARNAGAMLATVQKTMMDMFGEEGAQDISKESSFDAAATLPRTPEGTLDLDAAKKSKIIDEATAYSAILAGDRMNAGVAESVREILGEKKLAEFGYDASSAAKLAKSYNDRLDKYKIKSYGDTMAQVAPSIQPQRPGSTMQDYRMRTQDRSFQYENPTYAGGRISGAALQQRQQTRQQVDLKARENSAISRVWKNPSQGYATTSDGRQVMSLPGNMTAVARAEYERKNFKARTTAKMDGVTLELSGMEARQGMSNAQIFAEAKKSMTKDAAKKLDTYMKLSKALSLPMVIRDVVTGTSGYVHDGKLYVTLNGQQSIPRVVAHEMTHVMKEATASKYSALRNHLISEVGGKEEFEKLVNEKAKRYGLDLSTEAGRIEADDEVCAELCERMLSDPDALERLAEKDIGAAKTLRDKLLKILNAIKAALKDVKNRDFGDSKSDLIKQEQTIEAWFDALDDAIKHVNERANTTEGQIAQVAGVTTSDQESLIKDVKNAKTEEDIDKAFAEHSVDIIEYDMIGYHQDLMENLVPKGIMSEDEIDDLFSTMIEAVKYVKFHRDILDFGFRLSEEAQNDPELAEKEIQAAKAGRAYLPYKQNADPHYKLALDFSTLCKKRILLQMIQERLQGKLGRALSALETIAVRREIQKLQKNGVNVEVACALCYVEAARLKSPKVINEFLGVGLSAEERAKHVESEMKNYFAQKDKAIAKIIEAEQKEWKVKQLGADWRGTDKKGRTITAEKATKDHLKAFGGQALVDAFNEFSKERRTGERVGNALNSNQKEVIDEAKRLVQQSPKTFLSAESLAQLKKDNPDIFYAFTNKVRSATRSKALETDTFYSRGDISMVEEAIVRTANKESGFRHQSWSDFMPIHLLDTMASIIEMSQRDAKMHAYTKVPDMVRLLGKTGMMLNLSLIPKGETGLNADGTLAWDSVEGMAWEVMMELRDAYADTVGNIAIGISDEQIRQLLASDDIDYVIPYHVSGMNKTLRSHMGIHTWLDFTSSQNESEREGKAPSGRTWKEEHKARKMKPPALEAWFKEKDAKAAGKNGVAYMQKAAQDYLDICARDGWVPKFSQYLDYDAKANKYTVKPGYENYWKMLTDRKMVNQKTGEVIIQQAVKPRFDNAVVMDILRSEAEDPTAIRNAAAADEIAGELGKTWRGDKENANLKSYKAELDAFREASAVMAADRVKEQVEKKLAETRHSIDEDAVRQAFTVIDTAGIENGLMELKDVKHVGAFALKDISRFLDASAGGNKDLRNTLHAIFEAPHSEATGRYARGVERMQQRVLDIGQRAGVCDAKGKHFDSKKSAAIQNIGEGFSNTYTDLKLKVKDAEHVTVQAYDPTTKKLVDSEKDYTLQELRKAYGTNVADYVWERVFKQAENAQATGGKAGWIEQAVNTRPYTLNDLKAAFPNDWQKLKAAADEFRQMYDDYIRDQNNMLATIYPIESEYADVEKLEASIEKKQARLEKHKAAVADQLEALQKKLEAKEKEIAFTKSGKKRASDTNTHRQLVEQAGRIQERINELTAEIKEYEANAKDELVKMNNLKAEMQNAKQKGDYSLKRMHRLQYRSDYFHHFSEMASGIENLKSIFTNNTDIAPAIVGKSENTKAKTRWAGYFQQRMGGDYTADALNGMLRYGQLAEYKLAFDPLTAYLRDVTKQIADMSSETNRDGLIRYLQAWTDNIAGKSHRLDRVVSDAGMAPRKAMQVLQWINSRVIQNTLLWNMRSALIQISNITNAKGIVKNPIDWMNGLRAWAMAARGDEAMASIMAQSNFLASRYMDGLELTDSKLKSAKQFAGWMLGALDEISAKATWWAAYQSYVRNPSVAKNQYRAYDSAVDYADDVTRRTHAGRGVGELAPAMTSKVINFVAPFQVEVNNTWQLLKDNVKQKNYLGLLSTGLSVFLFNAAFEAIVGSTPLGFDFIRAVMDIVLGFTNDDDDDDPTVKSIAQRLAGELVGGLPFASQLVSAIGSDNAKKLLGEDNDATRYGNTQIGVNAVVNAAKGLKDIGSGLIEGRRVNWIDDLDDLLNLTMPMGAKQLTRTAQGLATVAKGYAGKYDNKGDEKVQFVTDSNILKYIHAGLFGKWALTEASEYFGEKRLLPELFGKYHGPKSSVGKPIDAKEYKAALATGIDGKTYFTLKSDLNGYSTQAGKRAELMQKNLTPEQKAQLDALMIVDSKKEAKTKDGVVYQKNSDGDWDVKADYSSATWNDVAELGTNRYEQARDAAALGMKPETFLGIYDKWKGMTGSDKKAQAKDFLDSLHLPKKQYDYIWASVFKYKA